MPIHTRTVITARYTAAAAVSHDITGIIARARSRDASFVSPFLYAKIGDDSVRSVVLGLYAGHNENGYKYLIEVSAEDIAFLWDDYRMELSRLDADQTNLLAELWLKEHMAEVDDAIVRNKFITMEKKNDELAAYYQARIDALASDRAALETKRLELELLRKEIANRIQRTLIQIQKEEIDKDMVRIDVLQKELAVQREKQKYIDVGIEVVEYQQKLTNAGYELALLESDFNKYAVENRRMDLKEANLSVQDIKYEAQLIRLQAELATSGLRLYRADTEHQENRLKSRKLDLDLIQEQIRKLRIETIAAQIAAKESKLAGAALKIDTDLAQAQAREIELDVRSLQTDTESVSLDIRQERIQSAIEKLNIDLDEQGLRIERIGGDRLKITLRSGRVDVRGVELDAESRSMDARIAKMNAAVDKIQTELAKVDLRVTQADAEISRMDARDYEIDAQIQKINTAIAGEGVKIIRIAGDRLRIQADEEKLESVEIEKIITEERLDNKEYESTVLHDAKVELLLAELYNVDQDQTLIISRLERLAELTEARKREIFESFAASVTGTLNQVTETRNRATTELAHNELRSAFANDVEIALGNEMDAEQRKLFHARYQAGHLQADYRIQRAKLLAKAEIQNTLTHLLGVAE